MEAALALPEWPYKPTGLVHVLRTCSASSLRTAKTRPAMQSTSQTARPAGAGSIARRASVTARSVSHRLPTARAIALSTQIAPLGFASSAHKSADAWRAVKPARAIQNAHPMYASNSSALVSVAQWGTANLVIETLIVSPAVVPTGTQPPTGAAAPLERPVPLALVPATAFPASAPAAPARRKSPPTRRQMRLVSGR
jgi:hypothetical protein